MTLACCISFLAGNASVYAQDPSPSTSPTYSPGKNPMYRQGWIDFNKNGKKDVYEDPDEAIDRRVEDLLSQMTLDEKTCQMATLYGYQRVLSDDLPNAGWKKKIWKDGIGAIDEHLNGFVSWGRPVSKNPNVWPASRHAWAINEVQRFFVEETRLGIPTDFTNEGIRGVEAAKATNFPCQLGIGHTWNRELVRQIGRITGREGRLLGYTNIYAPILDVARDQRWGRCEEVYGECPFLVAELGVEMVKGMQDQGQIISTGKHYLGYSNNKGGREGMSRSDPQMSPGEMEFVHVYPWREVIKRANMLGAMVCLNDYNGEPIESSHYWLTERLRGEMGFKGYLVSDSDAVEYMYFKWFTAPDLKDSVRQSVLAGLNVRCTFRSPDSYIQPLRELVKEGKIDEKVIDERVRDILRVKMAAGMFDHPYQSDLAAADKEVNSQENQKYALQASRESLVLLKNDNKTLPLNKKSLKKIAVIGPNADVKSYALLHYGPLDVDVTTVLEGIRNKAEGKATVTYVKGCELVDDNWPNSEIIREPLNEKEQKGIDEAVKVAGENDVVIMVLGGGGRTCGENKSRTSLELPGRQEDLLRAVHATGKPVVLVLINGRPLSINWAQKKIPAILEAWYPGAHGGTAVADVLFGDYNPGGKLTMTFPKTVGQIPFNFPTKVAAQLGHGSGTGPRGNLTLVNGPLYSFGHGLSYTTFHYSDLGISPATIKPGQNATITCTVKNTGDCAGDEVVQLYIRDVLSSVTAYEKVLRGFERIHLKPGESKKLNFTLKPEDLALVNGKGKWVTEPGQFKIMVGTSSDKIKLNGTLTYTDGNQSKAGGDQRETNLSNALIASADEDKAHHVIDRKKETFWPAKSGDYITMTLKENITPQKIGVDWNQGSNADFEIQLSSGGGQFLTVYHGTIHAEKGMEKKTYTFPGMVSSDIRVLITKGKAEVCELHVDGFMGNN
ncbi:glycoside hydrolase family 3 C-terminal domain-containing protein [Akkermansia glycaniphila]|uniref:glycoside hydrolase family 3 C-terminal domain-containing protein n=1 Tax=Akkermansia glycaniphila TaxID=1679444 RepID=UPI0031C00CB8|nr:glycoside hydrolase family 3 C-terminal domain-containing protein [Akkermansia glycaniphila]